MSETLWGIIIGGIIALSSSIVTYVLTGYIKIIGKIYVYFRKFKTEHADVLECKIELINTSNIIKVFRDINIEYHLNNKCVKQMVQSDSTTITSSKGEKNELLYGNNGTHSVLLQAQSSIIIHECFIDLTRQHVDFDKIVLIYYNQNNRKTKLVICKKDELNEIDHKWIKLKKMKRSKTNG